MTKKVSYKDCLDFMENYLHIELLDFQKRFLKHICNGEYIWGGRGCGRSTVIKGYTKYLAHLLEDYYDAKPNVTNSFVKSRNLKSSNFLNGKIEEAKLTLSPHSVKDRYWTEFYYIDEEPSVEFKNGSWMQVKE